MAANEEVDGTVSGISYEDSINYLSGTSPTRTDLEGTSAFEEGTYL